MKLLTFRKGTLVVRKKLLKDKPFKLGWFVGRGGFSCSGWWRRWCRCYVGYTSSTSDKQLTYSRNQEREADRIGMQYMYAAGYNPQKHGGLF